MVFYGIGLAIAVLALSTSLLHAPATAAEHRAAAAPAGDYCPPAEEFYGGGQYTYTRVQVCLNFASSNQVVVRNSETQYQWGGAWYYADNSYPARWNATGSVSKSGQSGNHATPDPVTQGSANGSASGGSPVVLNGCGSYSVTMTFHQSGPYWTDSSNDINSGQRSYTISVPCQQPTVPGSACPARYAASPGIGPAGRRATASDTPGR
ncbi:MULTISPECIES: hypothetical protein [Streptomyces]|uniref:Secreted protein n=1 Tax=Streptomyces griseocarneus TaxID=51201 RepID=A0ABX7RPJ3_9ACTN|nr:MULTISPECIES: hypothetical protein [Streptomyces]QSY49289.1 hypothetical protein J3S04_30820 [Streptomyces griseocarneus]